MAPFVEVIGTTDCPHMEATLQRVREVVGRLSPGVDVVERRVRTLEDVERLALPGSPTVRVEGADVEGVEGRPPGPPALACRTYDGSGVPPVWRIEAALLRAACPRHLLFLCVANSARSQMAEGIARALAPPGVTVSSAGSEPTHVRPEAVRALSELGIDASRQRSKAMDEVEGPVDAVVTLCAEEVCPVWLEAAWRVHWGLPDPAAVEGPDDARMDAFRDVRDELVRRLEALFGRPL
jgi:arsenate reductase (thioredoxin)